MSNVICEIKKKTNLLVNWSFKYFFIIWYNFSYRNALFRLNLLNLELIEDVPWESDYDKVQICLAKGQTDDNCNNFVKILLTDRERIFTCGTNAYSPRCTWREVCCKHKTFTISKVLIILD